MRSTGLFLAAALLSAPLRGASFGANKCTIKICHNKDCTKKGGGDQLLTIFRDLLPGEPSSIAHAVTIESSGCLSQCGTGPNVVVVESDSKKERLYVGVADSTDASAVLDVATGDCFGEECPLYLLVAASQIQEALTATSMTEKEKALSSAIETLTTPNDPTLLNSFCRAHALFLRADVRLEMGTPDVSGAVDDARLASQIAPGERRVWRVLASAYEADGKIKDAIEAFRTLARVDTSFASKAKNEIARLSVLL